ncbi:DUF697 domain-containing protein [Magnetococcales bacterium HHB-1]
MSIWKRVTGLRSDEEKNGAKGEENRSSEKGADASDARWKKLTQDASGAFGKGFKSLENGLEKGWRVVSDTLHTEKDKESTSVTTKQASSKHLPLDATGAESTLAEIRKASKEEKSSLASWDLTAWESRLEDQMSHFRTFWKDREVDQKIKEVSEQSGKYLLQTGARLHQVKNILTGRGMHLPKTEERVAVEPVEEPSTVQGLGHLDLAERSLRDLLDNDNVPAQVKEALKEEYRQVRDLLEKIELGQIHIAAFGRVSVGKSALLNALIGEELFEVSPLHGETKVVQKAAWKEAKASSDTSHGGVFLIDTPGINEVDGLDRELLARGVVDRSDLVLFVVDGDITETEHQALKSILADHHRPLILVLNKADRYTSVEKSLLLKTLVERTEEMVAPGYVVCCAAKPAEKVYIQVDEEGNETEVCRTPEPDLIELKELLWNILESEGKTLSAVNASLFAGKLSDQVSEGITRYHKETAEKVIRTYCLGKGVAVAFNPVPIADVLAVAADAAMIVNMGNIYGMPVNASEAGSLMKTIIGQMMLLMGAVWGVQLASSALKGVSLGLSTVFTAGTQGAVAYYGTYVVGKAAERYFAQGKSWGEGGPKQVVREILDSLDRESILAQARADILAKIKKAD